MKRVISLIMILIFVSGSCPVFAGEEVTYVTVEPVEYAETYIDSAISLFAEGKTLEQTLMEGWENLSGDIWLKDLNVPAENFAKIYRGILLNNPLFYYVSTGFIFSSSDGIVWEVSPEYTCGSKQVIAETIEAINEATEEILMHIDESMTDFEKVMAVHDYMVLHYDYDYTYSNYDATIMTTKTGVCMAYSMAFKHLMNELGIECVYVSSPTEMDHGWNLVKVDGEWYHIDLTWDDPGVKYGQVSHTYALLSDYEIRNLPEPHYGYDLNGLKADSDKYDKSLWHEGVGAIVTIDDTYYYVDDNNLVDNRGKIIYKNLSGDKYWDIGSGYVFPSGNYTGLAEYNGILYFNTDRGIYSYDPEKDVVSSVLEYVGICGLFIDRNTLSYGKYDMNKGRFVKAGEYCLGKIRFGGTLYSDGKIIKRIYTEDGAEDINVLAGSKDCVKLEKITKPGFAKISFDAKEGQTLFFWTDNLKPLKEKEVY